jgi:hypothetical protein
MNYKCRACRSGALATECSTLCLLNLVLFVEYSERQGLAKWPDERKIQFTLVFIRGLLLARDSLSFEKLCEHFRLEKTRHKYHHFLLAKPVIVVLLFLPMQFLIVMQ